MARSEGAIRVSGMQFSYDVQDPIFFDFSLDLPAGSRCLLVGANGSGNNNKSINFSSCFSGLLMRYDLRFDLSV